MNIADAIDPFVFRNDVEPIKDPLTHLVSMAGTVTLVSVLDQLWISDNSHLDQYTTVLDDDYDLDIQGLDITLASDLLNRNRSSATSRTISIACRTLTVYGDATKGITLDVSAIPDPRFATHLQPDVPAWLDNASARAANGDDIAVALNDPKRASEVGAWFETHPGEGWATQGAKGGSIRIACETLALHCPLFLKADGGRGNAGIGGQNVKNWIAGLIGGNAGRGGPGGDSGTIEFTCSRAVDAKGNPVSLDAWVHTSCEGGASGDPGLPGFAHDPAQDNHHYGSYAGPGIHGASGDSDVTVPNAFEYRKKESVRLLPDVSMVSLTCSPHYWALLYHRMKLSYLQHQPMRLRAPTATNASWVTLGNLVLWGEMLALPYALTSQRDAFLADTEADPHAAAKEPVANAMMLMAGWYRTGQSVWGTPFTSVSPLPFDTLCSYVDKYFVKQKGIRDFYIRLRKELADAIKTSADVAAIRDSAQYAMQMHKAGVDELRKALYGDTTAGGVDSRSLLGDLNAADTTCNLLIERLHADLSSPALEDLVKNKINLGIKDVLESLKNLCFVASDPEACAGMALIEGFGLYEKAVNEVTDDAGNSVAKDAVIKQLHQVTGSVDDLEKVVQGVVRNDEVGRLDTAIMTTLDNVDAFVSKFTSLLQGQGEKVLHDIGALRQKVGQKNQTWIEYNTRLHQLAKEWEDYQAAQAKAQGLATSTQQTLTASLMDTVQTYTGIYLSNLERAADLRARLLRKFAYITLDADLPSGDFLGEVSAFWKADKEAAASMAEQSDGNWDVNRDAVVGSDDSTSVRYQLSDYNAGSQTIVIKAPDDAASDKKSRFRIDIHGGGSAQDRRVIAGLLAGKPVWLQILPPKALHVSFTDANGEPAAPPNIPAIVAAYELNIGKEWDMRVTHVNPWMEGVKTDGDDVNFVIKLGTYAYIVDASTSPVARLFDYNGRAVTTEFAHLSRAKLQDPTNADMAGGPGGEVSDDNVDKRGIFSQIQLLISSPGIQAADRIEDVNLRICFRVIFRAQQALGLAARPAMRSASR